MQEWAAYIASLVKSKYNTHEMQNTRNTMAYRIQQQVKEYVTLSIFTLLCVGLSRSVFPCKYLLPYLYCFTQALPSPVIYQHVF